MWCYSRRQTRIPALPFCQVRLSARKPSNRAYPKELQTWGDHLRKRRLDLGLLQCEVAEQVDCSASSINHWETNRTQPNISQVPAIIAFLGYAPVDPSEPWFGRLARARQALGLSRMRLAAELGVDESTIKRWEDGRGTPSPRSQQRLAAALHSAQSGNAQLKRHRPHD